MRFKTRKQLEFLAERLWKLEKKVTNLDTSVQSVLTASTALTSASADLIAGYESLAQQVLALDPANHTAQDITDIQAAVQNISTVTTNIQNALNATNTALSGAAAANTAGSGVAAPSEDQGVSNGVSASGVADGSTPSDGGTEASQNVAGLAGNGDTTQGDGSADAGSVSSAAGDAGSSVQ